MALAQPTIDIKINDTLMKMNRELCIENVYLRDILHEALSAFKALNNMNRYPKSHWSYKAQEIISNVRKYNDSQLDGRRPCGYGPGDCSGNCYVCGNNPENDREEDDA